METEELNNQDELNDNNEQEGTGEEGQGTGDSFEAKYENSKKALKEERTKRQTLQSDMEKIQLQADNVIEKELNNPGWIRAHMKEAGFSVPEAKAAEREVKKVQEEVAKVEKKGGERSPELANRVASLEDIANKLVKAVQFQQDTADVRNYRSDMDVALDTALVGMSPKARKLVEKSARVYQGVDKMSIPDSIKQALTDAKDFYSDEMTLQAKAAQEKIDAQKQQPYETGEDDQKFLDREVKTLEDVEKGWDDLSERGRAFVDSRNR